MKKTIIILGLLVFGTLLTNCSNNKPQPPKKKIVSIFDKYSYKKLNEKPNKNWVGKYLKISFGNKAGKSLAGKTKLISISKSKKDSDGYPYFEVKDLSNGYLQEVYYFWFSNVKRKNNEFGPTIIDWHEATLK